MLRAGAQPKRLVDDWRKYHIVKGKQGFQHRDINKGVCHITGSEGDAGGNAVPGREAAYAAARMAPPRDAVDISPPPPHPLQTDSPTPPQLPYTRVSVVNLRNLGHRDFGWCVVILKRHSSIVGS